MTVSAGLCLLACLLLNVGFTLGSGPKKNMEFTFLLPAGSTECFHQTTTRGDTMEVQYRVLGGSGLDVGFALVSPGGHRLVSDFRRSDAVHWVDPTEDGDYRLCFDNSFSKLSQKVVYFEVAITGQSGPDGGWQEWVDMVTSENLVDYKLEDIRASMDAVYHHLEKSRQVQVALRAFEARDRFLLEDNLWRVSFWSCLNLLVMLTVAVSQIYTVRHLFDTKPVRT